MPLFSEIPESQRSGDRSAWTRLIAASTTPKASFVLGEEIAKLQQATSELWEAGSSWQLTPCSIVGLLASTGLRAGEVVALQVDDICLDSDPPQLYIRKTKFYKSRIV